MFQLSGPIQYTDVQYSTKLNALDLLVLRIQLKAERKRCTKKTKYDWSDDIHYTKIIINYWNLRRKAKTRKINVDEVYIEIYNKLPEAYQLYINSVTGSPNHNWIRSKETLATTLMVQHKKLMQKRNQDLLDNEAIFTGHIVDQLRQKKDTIFILLLDRVLHTLLYRNMM